MDLPIYIYQIVLNQRILLDGTVGGRGYRLVRLQGDLEHFQLAVLNNLSVN